jgi:hypothetical protein
MPTPQLPDHVLVLHREVQRKFGRNLLRLQQYEKLIKTIVAEHDIAGTSSDLNSNRAAKHDAVATKTLGQVVGALVGNFITPTSNSPSSSGNDEPPEDLTEPWVRVTHQIEFADDDFKRIQQRLADLVELRNELVHHFLEKHEILSEPGCLAAVAYLDECFNVIDSTHEEMVQWARHSADTRAAMASFINSAEFEGLFVRATQKSETDHD